MVDRDAKTLIPPAPAVEDPDAEHRRLARELATHEDPKVRILAHLSNRQFDLSERMSDMQASITDGFDMLKREVKQMARDLGDKIDKLDQGFVDVEERTTELEKQRNMNGSASPATTQ